jgi:hypothetical protein
MRSPRTVVVLRVVGPMPPGASASRTSRRKDGLSCTFMGRGQRLAPAHHRASEHVPASLHKVPASKPGVQIRPRACRHYGRGGRASHICRCSAFVRDVGRGRRTPGPLPRPRQMTDNSSKVETLHTHTHTHIRGPAPHFTLHTCLPTIATQADHS